jgi:hypothetical protein
MNRLFSEFFRKCSRGILGVCETIWGLFGGHFGGIWGKIRGKTIQKAKQAAKTLFFYYFKIAFK